MSMHAPERLICALHDATVRLAVIVSGGVLTSFGLARTRANRLSRLVDLILVRPRSIVPQLLRNLVKRIETRRWSRPVLLQPEQD